MRILFLIAPMLLCFSAVAGIYKYVDANGNVHYSDQEQAGAEEVDLPAAVTYTPTAARTPASGKAKPGKKQGYTEMSIVQPKMNETLRSNSGDVQVAIELKPGLATGDTITLYLDGKEEIKGSGQTSVMLTNVDRGSHTLRATVFNKNGVAVISSKSIIFHLHKGQIDPGASDGGNTEAFKPDYPKIESTPEKEADYSKDYKNNLGKDFGSGNGYQDKAADFKKGVPSGSGTFSPGSTYSPNYQQKK
ncbi:MAG: DUF4124 domain-containing protein [Gammaproteobacteria bacterium]|nr:DUF4124 domain-containing protein [Gammaproteobacteria bacterium]